MSEPTTMQPKPDALAFTPATNANIGYEPVDLPSAWKLAGILVASRFLPESVSTREQALAIMLTGRELGLTSMQAFRSIHVIKGKPTLSADLMVALVRRSPDCEYFVQVVSDAEKATYRTKRKSDPSETTMTYSMADAQRAGLAGSPTWKAHPAAMLRARCKAALARDAYPEALIGIYEPAELADEPEPRALVTETPHDPVTGEVVEPTMESTSQRVQAMPRGTGAGRGRRAAAQDTPFGAGPVQSPTDAAGPLAPGWGGDTPAQTATTREPAREPGSDDQ